MGGGGDKAPQAPAAPKPYEIAGYDSQEAWNDAKQKATDDANAWKDEQRAAMQAQGEAMNQMAQSQTDALNRQAAAAAAQAAANAAADAQAKEEEKKRLALAAAGRAGTVLTSGAGDTSTPTTLKPNLGS